MKKYLAVIALGMGLATAAGTTSWAQATGGPGGAGGPGNTTGAMDNTGAMNQDTGKVGSGNQPGASHSTAGAAGANEIQSTVSTDSGH